MIREKRNLEDFTHREISRIFFRARNLGELIAIENGRGFTPVKSGYMHYPGPVLVIDDELEMCQ